MSGRTEVEYRVVWKREGLRTKSRRYARVGQAERYLQIVEGRMAEATGLNPEAAACCDGWQCGCQGQTNAEVWAEVAARVPPLEWVRIEARPVGAWRLASSGEPTDD